jgi:hypothetical protein
VHTSEVLLVHEPYYITLFHELLRRRRRRRGGFRRILREFTCMLNNCTLVTWQCESQPPGTDEAVEFEEENNWLLFTTSGT